MQYRTIVKTGMEASVIGLGAEHLDGKPYDIVKETIDAAMEYEINIMDVFMPGSDIRQKIGKAISGNREKFIIQGHIGSTDINQQYDVSRNLNTCQKYFENLMLDLKTDYIDMGMLFLIDDETNFDKVFNSDIVKYAEKLKKNGTIRGIGASSHDPVIAKKIVETGVVDLLMFSINPAFDMMPAEVNVLNYLENEYDNDIMLEIDKKRMELYQTCENSEVAITVMKTLGGGKLLLEQHTPFHKPLTVEKCIHYALTRPAVVSTLIGCQSREQVQTAVSYLSSTDEERDYTEAITKIQKNFRGSCVYCNHCLPCPAGIDIAAVTKYYDIAYLDSSAVDKGIGRHYRELPKHGSDCIQCGQCEKKCPFSVSVMDNMQQASEVFGL